MNYFFNKTASITLVAIAITSSIFLIEKVASSSPENLTKLDDLSINETQIAQASEPIATQPGPKQTQVELVSTKVTGKILTVTLRYLPREDESITSINYLIEQVSYIEDDTGKQVGVLQNEQEEYLASPRSGNLINFAVASDPAIVWFKYPVPSPETQTISINIPEVVPFDGVPVQR